MNVILKAIYFLVQRGETNYQTHYRYIMFIMYLQTLKTCKKGKRRQNTKLNTTTLYTTVSKKNPHVKTRQILI